jgi:hypothetical protein
MAPRRSLPSQLASQIPFETCADGAPKAYPTVSHWIGAIQAIRDESRAEPVSWLRGVEPSPAIETPVGERLTGRGKASQMAGAVETPWRLGPKP